MHRFVHLTLVSVVYLHFFSPIYSFLTISLITNLYNFEKRLHYDETLKQKVVLHRTYPVTYKAAQLNSPSELTQVFKARRAWRDRVTWM